MKKNQNGFGAIESLLVVVIVGIIGFAGWYVYNAQGKANKNLKSAGQNQPAPYDDSSEATTEESEPDPTADWVAYSDAKGKFSLKHPSAWVKAKNLEMCSDGLLLIGATADTVGTCASENFGQMGISSMPGDITAEVVLSSGGYSSVTSQAVAVEGVTGVKETGTASGQQSEEGPGGLKDGTKVTKYIFYTNGRTYTATYVQSEGFPDALSDFELMVTKTLKFSS